MEEPIKIRLHILSPIHIGCDDVYDPTSFVISPEKKKLISFDAIEFIRKLTNDDLKKLNEITSKGTLASIVELYRFIFEKRSLISGREIDISDKIMERYLAVKNMSLNEKKIKQELNNFVIPRTVFNPFTGLPFIPGSSFKGSIRTGYLSALALGGGNKNGLKEFLLNNEIKSPIRNRKDAKQLEVELLKGSFSEDPFRLLKISDLLPEKAVKTKIIFAINYKKEKNQSGRGIPQIFETIQPGSIFEGFIEVIKPTNGANIKEPLEADILFRAVDRHYARVYRNEIEVAKQMGFKMPLVKTYADLLKERTGKRPFLLRLGRHSGAEAVTIEGNRSIGIRGRGGRINYASESTTIWLASEESKPSNLNQLMPFGWAMVEVL